MAEFRVLRESDVRDLIDRDSALALARDILRHQASDGSRLSAPSAMRLDATGTGGGTFMFKAATVGHIGATGLRLIAWPNNLHGPSRPSIYSLTFDRETGVPVGLVAGAWLSDVRAAAFGVVVMEALARQGPLKIGLFGTGNLAREIALMSFATFDLAEMRVMSKRADHAQAFAMELSKSASCPVRAVSDPRRVTDGADLIVTVTSAKEPLVHKGMLSAGAVLCSMGSFNEVAFDVLDDADRLVVDDPEYAAEMGDGGAWIAQGRLTKEEFLARIDVLASDVIAELQVGRTSDRDIIVALVQGMSTGDVAFANLALQLAKEHSVGCSMTLS